MKNFDFEQPARVRVEGGTRAWLQQLFGNAVLLNGKQVSQALGISNQTFRNWIWQKKFTLEPIRAGGPNSRPRWRLDDLANHLDTHRQAVPARRGRPKKSSLPSSPCEG